MLDLKFLLDNFEQVRERLKFRAKNINFDDIAEKASRRRELCASYDKLRFEQRQCGEDMKKLKGDAAAQLRSELKKMSDTLKDIENERTQIEDELKKILLYIPNLPAEDVPQGPDESANVEISCHGEIPTFDFEPKNHWEIAENLGIIDFERAAKVSGARFAFLKGAGCRLELALINYMMRLHAERGYTEIMPPFLVNRDSMTATGQLPKFEEDAYKTNDDMFLIPTAEVPVTNFYRDEILNVNDLPLSFCAYSACFRLEAGNYGKDTRGLIRQHQFDKVELLKFTTAETSEKEHLALLHDAEAVLQGLGLAYRVVMLSSGDMGFSARKCYDIEVWLPGSGIYREISSCSNFGDFQARRGNIRCKDGNAKPNFVHTINGSGLAVGRALVAVLENYQNADGSVRVPKVLQDAMGCDIIR